MTMCVPALAKRKRCTATRAPLSPPPMIAMLREEERAVMNRYVYCLRRRRRIRDEVTQLGK